MLSPLKDRLFALDPDNLRYLASEFHAYHVMAAHMNSKPGSLEVCVFMMQGVVAMYGRTPSFAESWAAAADWEQPGDPSMRLAVKLREDVSVILGTSASNVFDVMLWGGVANKITGLMREFFDDPRWDQIVTDEIAACLST